MAPGRKHGPSCWTCRLRRKRCDLVRPICGSCQVLDINCYSGDAKPAWMDGGHGQKHMSETIKGRIKQNAFLRRERRLLSHEDQGIIVATETDPVSRSDTVHPSPPSRASNSVVEDAESAESAASTLSTSDARPNALRSSVDGSETSQSPFTVASSIASPVTLPTGSSPWPAGLAVPIKVELGTIMIFLDYVFPFLFPFYQPSLLETGRQWLLGLLCQNESSFHIAASLSAYFFSLIPQDGRAMHNDCKALARNRLEEQMDMAFKSMQGTLSAINRHGAQSPLLDRIRIIEEITQLLIVEITVRRNLDWTIHLTPALYLFDEMFKNHGINHSEPSIAVLTSALPSPFPIGTPQHKPLPNTADQSALIFFVSLLLYVDVVASTSLGRSPSLQIYHHSLLSPNGEDHCRVRLETVIGCQNWALAAIGNISALCAWKRDAKQSGNFSVVNLVNLAGPISQALEEGLANLDFGATDPQPQKGSARRLEAYYSRHDRALDNISLANITRIWAYAAKIYLSVCLSGWQPNSTDTQASVAKVLTLVQTVESPAQLRSLSWPVCVAGCLALPSQEDEFRRVVGIIGPLGDFGTIFDALRIMEAVWNSRATVDVNVWDIASSLSILGPAALLL